MNEFLRGMETIGDISPLPASYDKFLPKQSEWQWVANSFAQAGYNIWVAIKELPYKTHLESRQAE